MTFQEELEAEAKNILLLTHLWFVDKPQRTKLNFCEARWLRITNASINLQKNDSSTSTVILFRSWVSSLVLG